MHILDRLDYLENKRANNIPMQFQEEQLREIVIDLKSELPKSYKEAWDHPNSKMRASWRKACGRELDSM